jgi:hypothetical protein
LIRSKVESVNSSPQIPIPQQFLWNPPDNLGVIVAPENPSAKIENKNREKLSMCILDLLADNDYLVIKRNHQKPLIVMEMDSFIQLYR